MVIGTVPDLETRIVPILAFLITIRDHVAGLGECVRTGGLKAGICIPFRVFDSAARGLDVEVVQRRLGRMRRRGMDAQSVAHRLRRPTV